LWLQGSESHFEESIEPIHLAEIVRSVLLRNNFAISCESQEKLSSIMADISLDFVNTLGLIENAARSDERQFAVQLIGDPKAFTFGVEVCGGVPAFLVLWNDVNVMYDEMEEGGGNALELVVEVNERMKELMGNVFVEDGDEIGIEVAVVKRHLRSK
jgi:hypothetical protein